MEPPATPPPAAPARRRRLSRGAVVALGLLLSLVGLFILGGTVPSAAGTLERAVAVTGAGALCLWVGGILLGRSGRV
ncbi:MAG TPA: hypothetical protein VEH10_01440 [Thermoplasmata archaeon]|nr:hypothetical protein [Thermoplasmata archaeon]